MNIFRPLPSPTDSARALADRHVVKMALESAQLLSTVAGGPYKPTHANHPCTLWAGTSRANAAWLLAHGLALCDEYTRRFGRVHGCAAVLGSIDLSTLPDRDGTPAVYVGPELPGATVEDRYRALLAAKYAAWGPLARWTNADRPAWC
jgi:hypothetical protein